LKLLLKIFLVLVLVAGGAAAWVWYGLTQPYHGFPSEGVFVQVPRGASSRTVARLLERNGVLRSALAFELYARRHPRRSLQAGEYLFSQPATATSIFWRLAKGDVYSVSFTVHEGETMFDIARDLEAGKFMPADDFLKAANNGDLIHDIAPQAQTLEGFLFPATYNLPRHPVPVELAAEMTHKFKEQWAMLKLAAGDPPGKADPQEAARIVTLASLVERETPRPEERPLVASVFENRLRRGMPLQCDPTVIYAMERLSQYSGKLMGADLRFDSPYNTYEHKGLPPGPIGNPGVASLRAVVQPAETDYLYFVANTQGGHFFSATLAEHNKNVVKYRRLLAGEPADPPPPEPVKHKKKKRAKAKHPLVAAR
jgi:UPF0755 protein